MTGNIKDLLKSHTGKLSSSHVWFHISNLAVIVMYLLIGKSVADTVYVNPANAGILMDAFVWLTLVVTGILTGNKLMNGILSTRLGGVKDATKE
jgi:hypothetical protein